MKKHIQSRNVKYGVVSLMLTALVLAAVIAFNVVISLLATRYEWLYISLAPQNYFTISEECEEYLRDYVIAVADEHNASLPEEEREKLVITFCDEKETLLAEDWTKYVYDSVLQIKEL